MTLDYGCQPTSLANNSSHTHTHTHTHTYVYKHIVTAPRNNCPVGWGCRIHQLLLCSEVRPTYHVVLDKTLNLMVKFQWCWIFAITPWSTHPRSVLMLNWIVFWHWNCTYAKLNYFEIELFWHLTVCKQKTILIQNWIVWNRTTFRYKNGFGIKKPTNVNMR